MAKEKRITGDEFVLLLVEKISELYPRKENEELKDYLVRLFLEIKNTKSRSQLVKEACPNVGPHHFLDLCFPLLPNEEFAALIVTTKAMQYFNPSHEEESLRDYRKRIQFAPHLMHPEGEGHRLLTSVFQEVSCFADETSQPVSSKTMKGDELLLLFALKISELYPQEEGEELVDYLVRFFLEAQKIKPDFSRLAPYISSLLSLINRNFDPELGVFFTLLSSEAFAASIVRVKVTLCFLPQNEGESLGSYIGRVQSEFLTSTFSEEEEFLMGKVFEKLGEMSWEEIHQPTLSCSR